MYYLSSPDISGTGYFIDADTVWQKAAPGPEHCVFGHMFASMKVGRNRFPPKHWVLNYLRKPREELYLASPFRFPSDSPVLGAAIERLEDLVKPGAAPTPEYNAFMEVMGKLISQWGLEKARGN